jgi:hypothetical protein
MSETTTEDVIAKAAEVDAQHEAMLQLQKDKEELQKKLDAFEKPAEAAPGNSIGGEPVPHHLHLVDGRVIANHLGIGTHFSEVIDGVENVVRVAAHYPAEEVHPNKKFA